MGGGWVSGSCIFGRYVCIAWANGATEQKCKILWEAIQKLSSLRSLHVEADDWAGPVGKLDWLHSVSSPPPLLRSLKLVGFLGEMPDWFGSLMHLTKIHLEGSELKGGKTMELLGALPNLMLLGLHHNAYVGKKLDFGEGAFPNLRKLAFVGSSGLREVRFEEGTTNDAILLLRVEIRDHWCQSPFKAHRDFAWKGW